MHPDLGDRVGDDVELAQFGDRVQDAGQTATQNPGRPLPERGLVALVLWLGSRHRMSWHELSPYVGLAVFTLASRALPAADWQIAPLVIAEQARVALGDEIGELLGARQVAILIGERPGLSCEDSLGIYLTHAPRSGRTDAERNCISNIHPDGGLGYERAAHKLVWLAHEAGKRQLTGVLLMDDSEDCPTMIGG